MGKMGAVAMGIRELRAKYGPKSKAPTVFARAVAAEIPGGARLLELKAALGKAKNERPDLEPYYSAVVAALDEMKTAIARKYDLASVRNEEEGALK